MLKRFLRLRKKQAKIRGREYTELDHKVSMLFYDTAAKAEKNVADENFDTSVRVLSLAAGLGKSSAAWAYLAARAKDPNFTAAYVAPTARLLEEAQGGIEELMGEQGTYLYSSYHRDKRKRSEKEIADAIRALGHDPKRRTDSTQLSEERVILVTHEKWRRECVEKEDLGVRYYNGRPRDLIVIEEFPDIVALYNMSPSTLEGLREILQEQKGELSPGLEALLEVLKNAAERGRYLRDTKETSQFFASELVTPSEGRAITNIRWPEIVELFKGMCAIERAEAVKGVEEVIRFLVSASTGCVFWCPRDYRFFAYGLDFVPGPGNVLLDATADLSRLYPLREDFREVSQLVEVDFSPLDIKHIDRPKEFKFVPGMNLSQVQAYARWIKQQMLEHSEKGDTILLIFHRKLIDLEAIPDANDPDKPWLWNGRKICTQHFGAGIGLNKFNRCNVAFVFGEWFKKKNQNAADYGAWSGETAEQIFSNKTRRGSRDHFDKIDEVQEGWVLRWIKQLTMRSAARNITPDGKCGPAKVFLAINETRLSQSFGLLFPGANKPEKANPLGKIAWQRKIGTQPDKLIDLMGSPECPEHVDSTYLEEQTGIRRKDLLRFFKREDVQEAMKANNKVACKATAIGEKGDRGWRVLNRDLYLSLRRDLSSSHQQPQLQREVSYSGMGSTQSLVHDQASLGQHEIAAKYLDD